MKKVKATYLGEDRWGRDSYQTIDGLIYKKVDGELHSTTDAGEPFTPASWIELDLVSEVELYLMSIHQLGLQTDVKQATIDDFTGWLPYIKIKAILRRFDYAGGKIGGMGIEDLSILMIEPVKLWEMVTRYSYIGGLSRTAHYADHVEGMNLDKQRFVDIVKVLSALLKEVK